jgi:hypothetical protein
MSAYDLTTLAAVKAWLGLPAPPTASDATLSALVTSASRAILAALSRPSLLPQVYQDIVTLESDRVFLNNWPVREVTSVTLDGLALPALGFNGPPASLGYLFYPGDVAPPGRPQALDILGRCYNRLRQTLVVAYQAGYSIVGETSPIPATTPYLLTAAAPFGPWASDLGVVYANTGAPLAAVTGAPAQGQYSAAGGVYRFAAADSGTAVSLSYGYVPQDLAQAATELAAERFRAAERIGLRSKSLGGQETIAYDLSGFSASVEALISPYKRTAF